MSMPFYVSPEQVMADKAEYAEFWRKLARGEAVTAEFRRRGKDGRFMADARYQECFDSRDYQEGLRAFAEGRDPVFNGS